MTFPNVHFTDVTKLESYSRCSSASTTGYRLPELLEFFNCMSIAGLDRLITGLPIQQIDILQRRLEQNVRLSVRHFRETLEHGKRSLTSLLRKIVDDSLRQCRQQQHEAAA
jgi:hypothetical protein